MKEVTAIFDIGKTNKKFFLLDKDLNEVYKVYTRFEEIPDDDGFMSENLPELVRWVKETFESVHKDPTYKITHVNISTYGASMVHLDENQEPVVPFYNYLKPMPEGFEDRFLSFFGTKENFELTTASPYLGFLNSGLQLYYLKYYKPHLFEKVKWSVHFPQYLSSLFTGRLLSDYTSIGCHTGLWDFKKNSYAEWVRHEGFDEKFPPIVASKTVFKKDDINFGVGIHDSSSALVPYVDANREPFALISTGTWSICMNVYNNSELTKSELNSDCLHFVRPDGQSIKASRLFLGDHLRTTVKRMAKHFKVSYELYKDIKWDENQKDQRESSDQMLFDHETLKPERFGFKNGSDSNFAKFNTFEEAVHHLFNELTDLQIASLNLAIGKSGVKKIFIDGGFSSSEVFTNYLARKLPQYEIYSSSFPLGSTLGAALIMQKKTLSEDFLDNVYEVQKIQPKQIK
ncbi:FGGY family carbohydrate kinase [Algoriphagus sediminis]|uniref:FGGY family carbohydrate kinase n=1 Tax=Algoriphagus sediminis TaxID=3057113 RepID=A0ABT7Y903_9BACT|nr:FGGY family carbohydrate kinase [Algoriphagus sediminis]MDN3202946.1 FGGY family carbohydrate kinase [Algoriphagus sediminis]